MGSVCFFVVVICINMKLISTARGTKFEGDDFHIGELSYLDKDLRYRPDSRCLIQNKEHHRWLERDCYMNVIDFVLHRRKVGCTLPKLQSHSIHRQLKNYRFFFKYF